MIQSSARQILKAALSLAFLVLFVIGPLTAAEVSAIKSVRLSKPFFNPSVGQTIRIDYRLRKGGALTVQVLDRDGFAVRYLAKGVAANAGHGNAVWNGKDDQGRIVPDEAYSLKIDLASGASSDTYFPANAPSQEIEVSANYYDRRSGVLSYKLERPARVHIQAGLARLNPKTRKREGPVLKTIANREPRPSGAVVENWNGFDEGGSFYVPALADFAVAIAATALPANAILASGNRQTQFLEHASKRTGRSLLTRKIGNHGHHRGLSTLDDVAPALRVNPVNAAWSSTERNWIAKDWSLSVVVALEGPSSGYFAKHPGRLVVFLDRIVVKEIASPSAPMRLDLSLRREAKDPQIVTFNWASDYGPVAVSTFRVANPRPQRVAAPPERSDGQ